MNYLPTLLTITLLGIGTGGAKGYSTPVSYKIVWKWVNWHAQQCVVYGHYK